MTAEALLLVDALLALLSAYFGVQAVLMFKKTSIGKIVDGINTKEEHKLRLLYATVFLGATLIAQSIIQGMIYLADTHISYSELAMTAVYLSFLFITYTWYGFLKDIG